MCRLLLLATPLMPPAGPTQGPRSPVRESRASLGCRSRSVAGLLWAVRLSGEPRRFCDPAPGVFAVPVSAAAGRNRYW